jgi:hypothetical protein
MVTPVMRGRVKLIRYADDLVICCELEHDALRIMKGLKARLTKYGLEHNEEKTKVVSFSKRRYGAGEKQGSFDFLGFTFFIGVSRNPKFFVPKLKTSRKRIKTKLKRVSEWVKLNRHKMRMRLLWEAFRRKLLGHVQYYGVSHNSMNVGRFLYEACKIFFKWMNRRSQKRSLTWGQFNKFMELYPPPQTKIYLKLF